MSFLIKNYSFVSSLCKYDEVPRSCMSINNLLTHLKPDKGQSVLTNGAKDSMPTKSQLQDVRKCYVHLTNHLNLGFEEPFEFLKSMFQLEEDYSSEECLMLLFGLDYVFDAMNKDNNDTMYKLQFHTSAVLKSRTNKDPEELPQHSSTNKSQQFSGDNQSKTSTKMTNKTIFNAKECEKSPLDNFHFINFTRYTTEQQYSKTKSMELMKKEADESKPSKKSPKNKSSSVQVLDTNNPTKTMVDQIEITPKFETLSEYDENAKDRLRSFMRDCNNLFVPGLLFHHELSINTTFRNHIKDGFVKHFECVTPDILYQIQHIVRDFNKAMNKLLVYSLAHLTPFLTNQEVDRVIDIANCVKSKDNIWATEYDLDLPFNSFRNFCKMMRDDEKLSNDNTKKRPNKVILSHWRSAVVQQCGLAIRLFSLKLATDYIFENCDKNSLTVTWLEECDFPNTRDENYGVNVESMSKLFCLFESILTRPTFPNSGLTLKERRIERMFGGVDTRNYLINSVLPMIALILPNVTSSWYPFTALQTNPMIPKDLFTNFVKIMENNKKHLHSNALNTGSEVHVKKMVLFCINRNAVVPDSINYCTGEAKEAKETNTARTTRTSRNLEDNEMENAFQKLFGHGSKEVLSQVANKMIIATLPNIYEYILNKYQYKQIEYDDDGVEIENFEDTCYDIVYISEFFNEVNNREDFVVFNLHETPSHNHLFMSGNSYSKESNSKENEEEGNEGEDKEKEVCKKGDGDEEEEEEEVEEEAEEQEEEDKEDGELDRKNSSAPLLREFSDLHRLFICYQNSDFRIECQHCTNAHMLFIANYHVEISEALHDLWNDKSSKKDIDQMMDIIDNIEIIKFVFSQSIYIDIDLMTGAFYSALFQDNLGQLRHHVCPHFGTKGHLRCQFGCISDLWGYLSPKDSDEVSYPVFNSGLKFKKCVCNIWKLDDCITDIHCYVSKFASDMMTQEEREIFSIKKEGEKKYIVGNKLLTCRLASVKANYDAKDLVPFHDLPYFVFRHFSDFKKPYVRIRSIENGKRKDFDLNIDNNENTFKTTDMKKQILKVHTITKQLIKDNQNEEWKVCLPCKRVNGYKFFYDQQVFPLNSGLKDVFPSCLDNWIDDTDSISSNNSNKYKRKLRNDESHGDVSQGIDFEVMDLNNDEYDENECNENTNKECEEGKWDENTNKKGEDVVSSSLKSLTKEESKGETSQSPSQSQNSLSESEDVIKPHRKNRSVLREDQDSDVHMSTSSDTKKLSKTVKISVQQTKPSPQKSIGFESLFRDHTKHVLHKEEKDVNHENSTSLTKDKEIIITKETEKQESTDDVTPTNMVDSVTNMRATSVEKESASRKDGDIKVTKNVPSSTMSLKSLENDLQQVSFTPTKMDLSGNVSNFTPLRKQLSGIKAQNKIHLTPDEERTVGDDSYIAENIMRAINAEANKDKTPPKKTTTSKKKSNISSRELSSLGNPSIHSSVAISKHGITRSSRYVTQESKIESATSLAIKGKRKKSEQKSDSDSQQQKIPRNKKTSRSAYFNQRKK